LRVNLTVRTNDNNNYNSIRQVFGVVVVDVTAGVVKFILKNDATVGLGLGLTNGPNGLADTFGG
jgi:hypothetical protein